MKRLIEGFKSFDGMDWSFFIVLGVANLFMLMFALVCLLYGAPVWLTVGMFVVSAGLLLGYWNATKFAMDMNTGRR